MVLRPVAPEPADRSLVHSPSGIEPTDSLGGVCAFLNLPEGAAGTTTIESKTNLLRAVKEGTVTATTTPLHRGRTLAVLETELRNGDGKLVAKTTQSQAFLRG